MPERLYAIGDIHGHTRHLVQLLDRLLADGMDPVRDTVVFLGDYIDRGPDSRRVIEIVRDSLRRFPHWGALTGNHEQMMLAALEQGTADPAIFDRWWLQGGRETLLSYGDIPAGDELALPELVRAIIPRDVQEWMATLPTMYESERYLFVHGGLRPGVPPDATSDHDRIWIREPFLESEYHWGKIVVHGHTPIREPLVRPNRIGIDTILRGGYLTAVELGGEEPRFLRSEASGAWSTSYVG
jgi:serine/threonine protein phosphatase 1